MNLSDFTISSGKNDPHLIEALFLYATMGLLVTNKQGEILVANPFVEKQFGYKPQELIGKTVEMLIPKRFQSSHIRHRAAFNKHPEGRAMGEGRDLYGLRKDGSEFPVEISLGYYNLGEDVYAIAFVIDVTVRKQNEIKIKELYDEMEDKVEERTYQLTETLEQLNQSKEELAKALSAEKDLNELKSRFVSTASHEFRTPLSTVLSSVYLLEKYTTTEDQAKRQKHIDRIKSSVHTLTDILNDFLSVGKIEEGKIVIRKSKMNVKNNITDIINELKSIQKTGQRILLQHEGKEEIYFDASLLKHIIINLVSNAIKFSPENSDIRIKSNFSNNKLSISVQDSGIGISKNDQEHLFERFFRGTNASSIQGTGLGLHIVAKYVELMNGTISCNSELNKGTRMNLEFTINNADE